MHKQKQSDLTCPILHLISVPHCLQAKMWLSGQFWVRKNEVRWPGIEPGSTAWKAAMLTTIPPSPSCNIPKLQKYSYYDSRKLQF